LRVSAVIPAYNEATRLPAVLEAVTSATGLDEVWVVSDGSTDDTYEVAASFPGVRALRLPRNRGKGAAMVAGAEAASTADVILFLDADLIGLTPEHVSALVEPVVEGRADMAVGVFRGGRFLTDLAQRITPCISGQRCMLRAAFLDAAHVAGLRSGVEVALYAFARDTGLRIVDVPLSGITHPMKEEKLGPVRGFAARMKMYGEIGVGLAVPAMRRRRRRLLEMLRYLAGG
jgi:glycosyltransferase involved in cell wall biosynthesis